MSASIHQFRSAGLSFPTGKPAGRAPIVTSQPPPGDDPWRSAPEFALPIVGALCGAFWALVIAAFVGFHEWLLLPVVVGCVYGLFLRGAMMTDDT